MRISFSVDDLDAELRKTRNREAGVARLTILGVSRRPDRFHAARFVAAGWVESWPRPNRSVKAI